MMVRIVINTDNAAFEDHVGAEVARILQGLVHKLEEEAGYNKLESGGVRFLHDSNGNTVGKLTAEDGTEVVQPINAVDKKTMNQLIRAMKGSINVLDNVTTCYELPTTEKNEIWFDTWRAKFPFMTMLMHSSPVMQFNVYWNRLNQ